MKINRRTMLALTLATGLVSPTLAFAELYDADEWQMRPHLLYLYCQGDLVCVRRFYQQRQRGLFYREPSPVGGYALLAGKVTVKGEGPLTFAVAPERHELTFTATHSAISLPERTTTTVQSWLNWLPTPMTTAPVDGSTNNPTLTVDAGGSPHTDFTYTITATLDTDHGPNLYVTRARIWFPQLKVDDGADQVNLLARWIQRGDAEHGRGGRGPGHAVERRIGGVAHHFDAAPGDARGGAARVVVRRRHGHSVTGGTQRVVHCAQPRRLPAVVVGQQDVERSGSAQRRRSGGRAGVRHQ